MLVFGLENQEAKAETSFADDLDSLDGDLELTEDAEDRLFGGCRWRCVRSVLPTLCKYLQF